jgi:hypothetical protein
MSSKDTNYRKPKRKATEVPEVVVNSSNTDAPVETKAASTANAAFVSAVDRKESLESIGALMQDLCYSDNAKVDATLDALLLNHVLNKKKCEKIVTVGGCLTLVLVMKKFLKKSARMFPALELVTEADGIELEILEKSLGVIFGLTTGHDIERCANAMSAVGVVKTVVKVMKTAVGVVKTVGVKVMKTIPKCSYSKWNGCSILCNLTICNVGIKKPSHWVELRFLLPLSRIT